MNTLESTVEALRTIERLGTKSRISEGNLRAAVATVAERIAVWIGSATELCDGYRIINLDPQLEVDGVSNSARYLVLTWRHDTARRVGVERALAPLPKGSWGGDGIVQATRAELIRFAADLQNGWLERVGDLIVQRHRALAVANTRVAFAAGKVPTEKVEKLS